MVSLSQAPASAGTPGPPSRRRISASPASKSTPAFCLHLATSSRPLSRSRTNRVSPRLFSLSSSSSSHRSVSPWG